MTRLTWLGGLAATLALSVTMAANTARAYESGPEIVYTICGNGVLEVCGSQTTGTNCSDKWSIDLGIIARVFGFKYEGESCTGTTTKSLYKNYDKNATELGVCFQWAPKDATQPGRTDMSDGLDEEYGSEC